MLENLINEKVIYRDDVVKCREKEGILGLVMEVPGDSDSEDSISDESEVEDGVESQGGGCNYNNTENGGEDGDENDHLDDGQCRVKWLDGSETTVSLNDVSVVDRGFLHGDFVASVADPTGQLGLVTDVSIIVDLLSPTGDVIKNVHSGNLVRIRKFAVGDFFLYGSWLGRVEDATDNVTVLFDDGSVCKVTNADPLSLKPVSKSIADDTDFPYYPGQRVRAASSSVFKGSRWLSGLWKPNRLEGTVSRVQTGSVYVYWIASSSTGSGEKPTEVPTEEQNPKDLTHLSCFAHANWELGQWCLYYGNNKGSKFSDRGLETHAESENNETHDCHCGLQCVSCTRNFDHEVGDQEVICALKPSEMREDQPRPNNALLSLDSTSVSNPHGMEESYDTNAHCANGFDGICKSDQRDSSEDLSAGYNIDDNGEKEMCNPTPKIEACGGISSDCKEPVRESWSAYRKKFRKVLVKREKKGRKKGESFERACLIINTRTEVDVVWQDGTRDFHLDSKSLIPINSPGDQEFFPEQYVIEKSINESDDSSEAKRVGVVRSLNSKERTACVRWLKTVSRPDEPKEFEKEEVVSAYELDAHPDYDYCYGDVVVRLSPVSFSSSPNAMCPAERQEDHTNSCKNENETDIRSTACYTERTPHNELDAESELPWVGHITGLKDGDIEVRWADGMISTVGPQAVYVVGREDDGEPFDGGSEYSDGASWETVEENEITSLNNEPGLSPATDTSKAEVSSPCPSDGGDPLRKGPFSTAISYVKNLATGFLSHGKKQIDLSDSDIKNSKETELHKTIEAVSNKQSIPKESEQICDHDKLSGPASEDECRSEKDTSSPDPNKNFSEHSPKETGVKSNMVDDGNDSCGFRHFDITTTPLDHHFLGDGQAGGSKQWVKKVQQEWNILEKNLPDAIYVQVFEDRMDILRAVIIGACGTPYQDGLFFFDFKLPLEYPQVPPSAYYHSGGLRINPNLYEEGKVCLSLLNTWTGKGNEIWDPSSSSILQVLVSLQGLVLNSKPYFNEAGYDKQIGTAEGEKNYLPYNENTFLLNLKSMMYLLRRPPMHFEDFVKDHFRRRGHYILKACDAYMKGCLVGSLTRDACASDEISNHSCSVGFKLMLAKIVPRLIAALSEIGADCSGFEHFINS